MQLLQQLKLQKHVTERVKKLAYSKEGSNFKLLEKLV